MKRGMFRICLLAAMVMAVGLSGCKITSATPDPNLIISAKPRDRLLFKVEGPANSFYSKSLWYVRTKNDPFGFNKVADGRNEFEYEVVGDEANKIEVICYSVYPGYFPTRSPTPMMDGWCIEEYRVWEVRIDPGTPLVTYQNYAIEDSNDIPGLRECRTLTGNLIVYGDIGSLAGLEKLTSVYGRMDVTYTSLTDFDGLDNLKSAGELDIYNNDFLKSLSGLEGLTTVSGLLYVGDNRSLMNLSGLENLASAGQLAIHWNKSLTSLGMTDLLKVSGDFDISYNTLLCKSLAEALSDQVEARDGIGGEKIIEGNKDCTTP